MHRLPAFGLISLFSLALFTSAALMFSVQPMVGKMLLPIVGGTPAGWIVAMAFFQLALLAGYTLAYGFSRLPARGHAVAYILTLALGGAFLPVIITAEGAQETLDAGGTFMLLAATIGLPFVALSTTSTTLQRLFSATNHSAAHDPYFLYAASNLGSFGGLLLYPLLIEPGFTLGQQSEGWFGFYAALVAMAVMCLLALGHSRASAQNTTTSETAAAPFPLRRCLRWVAYAFIPASLLMGYTSFITSDLYAAPLIWVIPLAIYLLTFVLAFRSPAVVSAQRLAKWHIVAVAVSLVLIVLSSSILRTSLQPIIIHLLAFGVIAMAFHLRLYEDRPLGSARQLAAFYLLISLGGALAGIFNAFVAPMVFSSAIELPVILLASLLLAPKFDLKLKMTDYVLIGITCIASIAFVLAPEVERKSLRLALCACAILLLCGAYNPRTLIIGGVIIFFTYVQHKDDDILSRVRNFYGTVTIYDQKMFYGDIAQKQHAVRFMRHDTTLHGFQVLSGPENLMPPAYFAPLNEVFHTHNPRKVAILGLGAGHMLCFTPIGTETTFIDINPAIIDAAKKYFTYLKGCAHGPAVRVIQGDGRLELAKLENEKFDLIVLDVFSSEYIPAHIATREALGMYIERLAPDGMIIFHISNNFFDLAPILTAAAKDAGFEYRLVERFVINGEVLKRPGRLLAITKDASVFDNYTDFEWKKVEYPDNVRMWTDDFTDYISIMRKDVFSFKRWLQADSYATAKPTPATPDAMMSE